MRTSSLVAVRAALVIAWLAPAVPTDVSSLVGIEPASAGGLIESPGSAGARSAAKQRGELIDPASISSAVEPAAEAVAPSPPAPSLDDLVRAGRQWRLDTPHGPIHVWIPAGYDPATAATIVFVHGYWIQVDAAWMCYRLAHQFALSGINAMFIAPTVPSAKWIPLGWPSLSELVRTVASSVDVAMPTQRLAIVGHSGAYRTLAVWLANPTLDTVVILDGLYGEYSFLPWVRKSPQHRLVNIVYETGEFSDYLHSQLPSTRRVDGLPLDGLPDARILYVRTRAGHWQLVTDGIALPLALRAIGVPQVASARLDIPLGLPLQCDAPRADDDGEHVAVTAPPVP